MSRASSPIALIHTSPLALEVVGAYYRSQAPEFKFINLLEDGLLGCFSEGQDEMVERRLTEMIRVAALEYGACAAVLTCSSVDPEMTRRLRQPGLLPIMKIDEPMADQAVGHGHRIGVLATFSPTLTSTRQLLESAASAQQRSIEVFDQAIPEAPAALLKGDTQQHDDLLEEAARKLAAYQLHVLVLAQVSMARTRSRLQACLPLPVLSSLETSLEALKRMLL